jgi:hypothetical protein
VQTRFTPETKDDEAGKQGEKILESQSDRAVQPALKVQPMSHLPRDWGVLKNCWEREESLGETCFMRPTRTADR